MLREYGAAEVHVRISSPPVAWPCFYGIDFASRAELVASNLTVEQIRESIGADTLAYVSLEGLTAASRQPADSLCRACFTGDYPIEIPEADLIGKHVLEGLSKKAVRAMDAPSDHDHTPEGVTVVHNGLQDVDSMDAVLPGPDGVLPPLAERPAGAAR
jgi:amidophosphoribosyltransferase